MSRILILFASHFGQTCAVSKYIAERLRVLGHEVDVVDVRSAPACLPPPEDYDIVVVGSRVETGRHSFDVRNYISKHLDSLRTIPTAFFSVSMAAARSSSSLACSANLAANPIPPVISTAICSVSFC